MEQFGQKLKSWRISNGLSQTDLADSLNYGLRSIQDWEHNYRLPSYDAIISVANIMGVSTDWLLGRCVEWKTADALQMEYESKAGGVDI